MSTQNHDSPDPSATGSEPTPPKTDAAQEAGFEAPQAGDLGSQEADQQAQSLATDFGADLLALKGEIETKLSTNCQAANAEGAAIQALEGDNIVGVGLTFPDADDLTRGAAGAPGEPALSVFTLEPCSQDKLQAEIASAAGTRALSTAPVVQVPVGPVDALAHRFRLRPAPGGISCGHFAITAGTLGCLSVGNSAPRNQRLMVLSNNHVIANSNNARLGDCISQPGPADGGRCPGDQIAILERFVPISFGSGVNFVDAATAWAWPDRVRRELIYLSGGARRFFRIGASPIEARVGMVVGKSGRTTQLRQGRVTAVNVTVNVNYNGRVAQFRDQFSVRGVSGDFSAGGDSGSAVWEWARGVRPAGLLFAGGGGTTFCNRMSRVVSALDIRLFT